ncbi:hypothetical protein, partial [uncultured Bacteroides sp.]|uniref:hypothetical protein n=1 Tax=uncultured Bacteroides sp. TaxID=162156 RepID=UPI0026003212
MAVVYDYVIYNFYTALAETNLDSTNWRAIRVAIERVESGIINKNNIDDALKIVKSIGLLNLFYNGVVVDFAYFGDTHPAISVISTQFVSYKMALG